MNIGAAYFTISTDAKAFDKGLEEAKKSAAAAGKAIQADLSKATRLPVPDTRQASAGLSTFGRQLNVLTGPVALLGSEYSRAFSTIRATTIAANDALSVTSARSVAATSNMGRLASAATAASRAFGLLAVAMTAALAVHQGLDALGVDLSPEAGQKGFLGLPSSNEQWLWVRNQLGPVGGVIPSSWAYSDEEAARRAKAKESAASVDDVTTAIEKAGRAAASAAPDLADLGGSAGAAAQKLNILEDGIISFAEAVAEGMSAMEAGAVEAEDTLARGLDAINEKAFNTEKTLAKLAYTLERDDSAGRRLVLTLAEDALARTRAATQALFATPTREQTALDLSQAQFRVGQIQLQMAINPQLDRLRDALEDVQSSADDQTRALDASARILSDRLAGVQEAAERQIEAMDQLIEAAREEAEARRTALQREGEDARYELEKRRRELQAELEDTQKSVAVTDKERLARGQHIDALEAALKSLDDAEFEMGRTFQLRARNLEDSTREELDSLEDRRRAVEDSTRAQERAVRSQIDAIERQRRAIIDGTDTQARALQKQMEALQRNLELYDRSGDAVRYQSDLLRAQHDVMRLSIEAQDATRLSEEELGRKAIEVADMMRVQSGAVRDLTGQLDQELVPELREARDAHALLTQALQALNDPVLRSSLIPAIDAAALRASILARAMEDGAGTIGGAVGRMAEKLEEAAEDYKRATAMSWQTFDNNLDVLYGTVKREIGVVSGAWAELAENRYRSENFSTLPYENSPPLPQGDVGPFDSSAGNQGFRAAGGPVSPGVPYVVGERGWEMFVPSVAGMILDHAESMRRMQDYRAFAESFRRPSVSTVARAGSEQGQGDVNLHFNAPVTIEARSRAEAERSADNFGWGIAATMRSRGIRS